MVQREEIAIHEAKARNALKQGRQDLAREALRWKACHEEKLSELGAELQELTQGDLLSKRPDTSTRTDRSPTTALKPLPPPSALIAIEQQTRRWNQGPGGAILPVLTKDTHEFGKAARDLAAARKMGDRQAISRTAARLRFVAISLESHVAAAIAAPPKPEAECQRLWASVLLNTHILAVNAKAYTQNFEQARLDLVREALHASEADMQQLEERLRAMAKALKQYKAERASDDRHNQLKDSSGVNGISSPSTAQVQAPQADAAGAPGKTSITLESLLAQLDSLIGLAPVKADVRRVIDMARVTQRRQAAGLPVVQVSRHLVFTGNPGTGKTTVARLLAQLYAAIGLLRTGQLVEVTRNELVAGYVGQTAIKTTATVTRALGGVLFIDEAYSLARSSGSSQDFGLEAIDTIVKMMEDNRDQLIVIAAGYGNEMTDFINANPGLPSRFPHIIHFPDYGDDELVAIFAKMCSQDQYDISPATLSALHDYVSRLPRERGFGNGRMIRNLFEEALTRQASRIIATGESNLTHLTMSDLGMPSAAYRGSDTGNAPSGSYI
jgi:SpoVK/Ycf46/Vps4 family AAA+-type ATPase